MDIMKKIIYVKNVINQIWYVKKMVMILIVCLVKDNKYLTNDSLYCVFIYGINYYINESEKICYKNVVKIVKNSPGEV